MIKFSKKNGCCNAPYSVNISVTERCPLKCPFCFHEYDNYNELSFSSICEYIDELASMGTAQVQFSGGEPLVYQHIFESIAYAHSKGMRVVISTSGVFVTEEITQKLMAAGLDCCYISLNGSTAKIHEVTRDGFRFAINALEIFKKMGMASAINWVASHENVKDLRKLISLAKSMGVKHISIIPMKKCGGGREIEKLTKEDLAYLWEYCKSNRDYLIIESCFEEIFPEAKCNKSVSSGCRAGKFYMAVNAKGEFLGCPHLFGTATTAETIKEYWNYNESLSQFRRRDSNSCLTVLSE